MSERLSLPEISEIAQDVTRDYSPRELPSLDDVAWAFPVEGQDGVHYLRRGYMDRIPNTQETNAMRELMTYKNFHNVLLSLAEGKTTGRGLIPNHTFPCGDADDGAYMVYPYIKQRESELGNREPKGGFFWETMPSGLVTAILKVERTGRGNTVDETGEKIERVGEIAYVNTELTRQYLQNLRTASEMGREHFHSVLQSRDQVENYPQLVLDANFENWDENTQFQLGYYSDGKEPRFLYGRGVKDYDGTEITLLCHYPVSAGGDGNEWDWRVPADILKKLGQKSLWRLELPKK